MQLLQQAETATPYSPLSRLAYSLISFKPGFLCRHLDNTDPRIRFCDHYSRQLQAASAARAHKLPEGSNAETPVDTVTMDPPAKDGTAGPELPKSWSKPGRVVSTQEILDFVAETTQKYTNFSDVSDDELLVVVGTIENLEDNILAQNHTTVPTVKSSHDILDHISFNFQGDQKKPRLYVPSYRATSADMFEASLSDITRASNPYLIHQSLQFLSLDTIFEEQQKDKTIKGIIEELQNFTSSKHPIPRRLNKFKLVHDNKLLAKRIQGATDNELSQFKLVLPLNLLVTQCALLHSLSHAGPKRIFQMFKKLFYADHAAEIITSLISTCKGCRYFNPTHIPRLRGGHHPHVNNTLDSISIDVFQLPSGNWKQGGVAGGGHLDSFLTLVDCKSNFVWAAYLKNQSDTEIVRALTNFFTFTSATPTYFHSDNATNLLRSRRVREFLFQQGVKNLKLSIPYHSKSASKVELSNGLIKYTMKRLKVLFPEKRWPQLLPIAVSMCNCTVRRYPVLKKGETKISHIYATPYEVQYQRMPSESLRTLLESLGISSTQTDAFLLRQRKYIDAAHAKLDAEAKEDDEIEKISPLKAGALVLLRNEVRGKHDLRYFKDLYQIVSVYRRLAVIRNLSHPTERQQRVHVSRLKHFKVNDYADLLPRKPADKFGMYEQDKKAIQAKVPEDNSPASRPYRILRRKRETEDVMAPPPMSAPPSSSTTSAGGGAPPPVQGPAIKAPGPHTGPTPPTTIPAAGQRGHTWGQPPVIPVMGGAPPPSARTGGAIPSAHTKPSAPSATGANTPAARSATITPNPRSPMSGGSAKTKISLPYSDLFGPDDWIWDEAYEKQTNISQESSPKSQPSRDTSSIFSLKGLAERARSLTKSLTKTPLSSPRSSKSKDETFVTPAPAPEPEEPALRRSMRPKKKVVKLNL